MTRKVTKKMAAVPKSLRGLERKTAEGDPVDGPEFGLAQDQRGAQQKNGASGHQPADALDPIQVPEKDAQHDEKNETQQKGG